MTRYVAPILSFVLHLAPSHVLQICQVAGNGIRCVGHLAVVILRPDYSLALKQIGWNVEEFCRQSVCWLVQLVEAVPACVVGDRKLELSWKQRSVAKKHGRVACNTLVLFMKHWSVSDITIECIREALCSVVNCLESLGTALDDKFIIAATHVVRALPSSSLAKVSGKKCFVGKALVPCIHFIAQVRRPGMLFCIHEAKTNLLTLWLPAF